MTMPRQQQQQESSMLIDMRTSFNLLNFLADAHTASIRPFTRSGMGTRGIGAPGFWAMLLILAYAGFANAPEMILYFWAWLAMVVYRRITADRRQHTDFQGWVWMFDWCLKDELKAHLLEAVSMWAIGGFLCGFSEPLGQFVMLGAVSFGVKYAINAATVARRREAAHNARIEMETMQRQFEDERPQR
jgi:hypothetical protein